MGRRSVISVLGQMARILVGEWGERQPDAETLKELVPKAVKAYDAALAEAREEGRQEALREAARICRGKAERLHRAAAVGASHCAEAITRALVEAPAQRPLPAEDEWKCQRCGKESRRLNRRYPDDKQGRCDSCHIDEGLPDRMRLAAAVEAGEGGDER